MNVWDSFTDKQEEGKKSEVPCARIGGTCPVCKAGELVYNGKLELVCPVCRIVYSAGFT